MATLEEKQELVETLKGPKYYRISLYGYGGESSYIKLSKEAYDFWKPVVEEHGDADIVHYMVEAQDLDGEQFEFEDIDGVPEYANFMKDKDGDYSTWYEHHDQFEHQYGVDYNNCNISVEEVDSDDYSASSIKDIVEGMDLNEYIDGVQAENDYEFELVEMDCTDSEEPPYVLQFWSSEKGSFFDGIIETIGPFDPKKLKIYTTEFLNGDDTVMSIEYDGVDVDNQGGDTNGKGYSVHLWSNE